MKSPFENWKVGNAKVGLDVGQILMCLVAAIVFSGLSMAISRVSGRSAGYYASQLVAVIFILLGLVILALKMVLLQ